MLPKKITSQIFCSQETPRVSSEIQLTSARIMPASFLMHEMAANTSTMFFHLIVQVNELSSPKLPIKS